MSRWMYLNAQKSILWRDKAVKKISNNYTERYTEKGCETKNTRANTMEAQEKPISTLLQDPFQIECLDSSS